MTSQSVDWRGCPGVEFDPAKLSGAANIRGMRIPPEAVLENYNDGMSMAEIKEQFEGVQDSDIWNVLNFAAEHGLLLRPLGG
jgi:uncharacterized protein (DUF433 family)